MRTTIRHVGIVATVVFCLCSTVAGQSDCSGTKALSEKTCLGDDLSALERRLFDILNNYRVSNDLRPLKLSVSLTMVANRRMLDLKQNMRKLTHSWSNCPYVLADAKTWPCVMEAPKRLGSGYKGNGYETLYRTAAGEADPAGALEAWKKSALHNSIILNTDGFRALEWDEVGVAIDGEYAALWFGSPDNAAMQLPEGKLGLGVSYADAVAGLSKLLSIDLASSTVETNRWSGTTANKMATVEVFGSTAEVNEANVAMTLRLGPEAKLDPTSRQVTVTLLKNLFPEWNDTDAWVDRSVAALAADPSAWRAKTVRKIAIELRSGGSSAIRLLIRPQRKPMGYEVF